MAWFYQQSNDSENILFQKIQEDYDLSTRDLENLPPTKKPFKSWSDSDDDEEEEENEEDDDDSYEDDDDFNVTEMCTDGVDKELEMKVKHIPFVIFNNRVLTHT